jgi:hypothetical protein
MYEDYAYKIHDWIQLLFSNYDPVIEKYGTKFMYTELGSVLTDQLTHAVVNSAPIAGVQILTYYKEPWQEGFILNTPGLTNYRGFIEEEPLINSDDILYK